MELSRFTDYSIRFLIFAGIHPDEWVAVPQAAEAYQISGHHLVKVAHNLSKEGYIEAKRGRHGGFRLACSPGDIHIGTLVRLTETLDIVECNRPDGGHCVITGACVLKRAIGEAREAFLSTLDRYTLADFLKPHQALLKEFAVPSGQQ